MNQVREIPDFFRIEYYIKEALKWINNHWILINAIKQWNSWKTDFSPSQNKLHGVFEWMIRRFPDFQSDIENMAENVFHYMYQADQRFLDSFILLLGEIADAHKETTMEPIVQEPVEEIEERVKELLSYEIRNIPQDDKRFRSWFWYEVIVDGKTHSSKKKPIEHIWEDGRVDKIDIFTWEWRNQTPHTISL